MYGNKTPNVTRYWGIVTDQWGAEVWRGTARYDASEARADAEEQISIINSYR